MSDEMVALGTFANAFEADMARNRLAEEGIAAFVSGEASGTLFSGGTNLLGAVQLFVAESHRERALTILEGDQEDEPEDEPQDEAGGTAIKSPDWPRPGNAPAAEADTRVRGIKQQVVAGDPSPASLHDDQPELEDAEDEEEKYEVAWGPAQLAARAFKTAGVGLLLSLFVPIFTPAPLIAAAVTGYSIVLLVRLAKLDEPLSPLARWQIVLAILLNIIAIIVLPFLVLMFLGRLAVLLR